jgi:hypothetical protein
VVDTSRVVTETETSPLVFSGGMTVTGDGTKIHADSVWAGWASIDYAHLLTGLDAGGILTGDISQTDSHWFMLADSSYWDSGGWFAHKLTVGSSTGADGLVVNGTIEAAGTSFLHSVAATGQVTATDKVVSADSVCAHGALRSGTASAAGSVVLSDGSGHAQTVQASANLAGNVTTNLFQWQDADTCLLSIGRFEAGDRIMSKYWPGVQPGDLCIVSAMQHVGASMPALNVVGGGTSGSAADSIGVTWGGGDDSKILTIVVVRP